MSQVQSESDELQEGYQEVQIGPERLEIPEEWTVTTVNNVASRFISGGTPDSGNENYWGGDIPWTTAAVVEGPQFDGEKDFITQEGLENSSASLVPEGSILFGTRVNVANVGRTNKDIAISQDLTGIVLDESKVDPDFVSWHLLLNQTKIRDRYSQGSTIQGMLTDDLKSLPLLYPSLSEQRRIADILSTVNEQIQQTDEIIEILDELKQGILQDLLQRGIGHNELQQENIGPISTTIPKDWKLKSIGEVIQSGKKGLRGGPPGSRIKKEDRVADGYKLYVQDHVINDNFDLRDDYISEEKFSELKSAAPKPRDVLVTRRGTIGKSTVFPESARDGIISDSLIRIRPEASLCLPEFLSTLISSSNLIDLQIRSLSHGSSRKGLNNKIVKQLELPLPPIEEQEKIIQILSCLSGAKEIEERRRSQLSLLKDGLMQDLLTGKVRVNTD